MGTGAVWSPDSQHFATGSDTGGRIYDAAGQPLRTIAIGSRSWLDTSRVAGIGTASGGAFVYDIDSGAFTAVALPDRPDNPIANGRGAVAFNWPSADNNGFDTNDDYAIWSGDALSAPQHGFAQAWSPDGSRLAVVHIFDGLSDGGWVSVLSWPGLNVQFDDAPPYGAGDVDFDPSGRYVAYDTDNNEGIDGTLLIRVVDLQDGCIADIPRDIYGNFYWIEDGVLAYVSHDGVLRTYRADGTLVSRSDAPFLLTATSDDSSTVAFWDGDDHAVPTFRLVRNGKESSVRAPGDVLGVSVSPDGSAVVVDVKGGRSYLYRP